MGISTGIDIEGVRDAALKLGRAMGWDLPGRYARTGRFLYAAMSGSGR
jgi:hypothetical protein